MNVTTGKNRKGEPKQMSNVTLEDTQQAAAEATQPDSNRNKRPTAAPRHKATKTPSKDKKGKKGTKAAAKTAARLARQPAEERKNKKAEVVAMMRRPKGATLAEIMAATGWQKHTVRGFVSLLGKKGEAQIESSKNSDGARTYKVGK